VRWRNYDNTLSHFHRILERNGQTDEHRFAIWISRVNMLTRDKHSSRRYERISAPSSFHRNIGSTIPGITPRTNIILPWSVPTAIRQVWPTHLSSYEDWAMGKRSFAVNGPVVWNSLPTELRSPEISLDVFKAKLKTFLFNCWLTALEMSLIIIILIIIKWCVFYGSPSPCIAYVTTLLLKYNAQII